MSHPKLGILITTCDNDSKHFDRILSEFTRLDYPFAVNFDHCSEQTKKLFKSHPLYVGGRENDDPKVLFDERDRQYPFDILEKLGMEWITYLDTDEVYDKRAPQMIPELLEKYKHYDMIWCPQLDFWGDDKHYRTDGPFGPEMNPDVKSVKGKQFRKKFYNLMGNRSWRYLHADIHAPYLYKKVGRVYIQRQPEMVRCSLYVLHYGLMSTDDGLVHKQRWDEIYTRTLGRQPYEIYNYTSDKRILPELVEFDYDTFDGK